MKKLIHRFLNWLLTRVFGQTHEEMVDLYARSERAYAERKVYIDTMDWVFRRADRAGRQFESVIDIADWLRKEYTAILEGKKDLEVRMAAQAKRTTYKGSQIEDDSLAIARRGMINVMRYLGNTLYTSACPIPIGTSDNVVDMVMKEMPDGVSKARLAEWLLDCECTAKDQLMQIDAAIKITRTREPFRLERQSELENDVDLFGGNTTLLLDLMDKEITAEHGMSGAGMLDQYIEYIDRQRLTHREHLSWMCRQIQTDIERIRLLICREKPKYDQAGDIAMPLWENLFERGIKHEICSNAKMGKFAHEIQEFGDEQSLEVLRIETREEMEIRTRGQRKDLFDTRDIR